MSASDRDSGVSRTRKERRRNLQANVILSANAISTMNFPETMESSAHQIPGELGTTLRTHMPALVVSFEFD